jgi:hypothetical protein
MDADRPVDVDTEVLQRASIIIAGVFKDVVARLRTMFGDALGTQPKVDAKLIRRLTKEALAGDERSLMQLGQEYQKGGRAAYQEILRAMREEGAL